MSVAARPKGCSSHRSRNGFKRASKASHGSATMLHTGCGWTPPRGRNWRRLGTSDGGIDTLVPGALPLDAGGSNPVLPAAPCMHRASTDLQPSVPCRRLWNSNLSSSFFGDMVIGTFVFELSTWAWA